MTTPNYPPLDEGTLKIIAMKLADDPNYLTNTNCPYHKDTVSMFIKPTTTHIPEEVNGLERQKAILNKMREQLDEQSDRQDSGMLETSASNAYFGQRIKNEKEILELEKQIHFIENVDAFYATVLTIMEDVLDTDQKDEVMSRLRAIKEKEA